MQNWHHCIKVYIVTYARVRRYNHINWPYKNLMQGKVGRKGGEGVDWMCLHPGLNKNWAGIAVGPATTCASVWFK